MSIIFLGLFGWGCLIQTRKVIKPVIFVAVRIVDSAAVKICVIGRSVLTERPTLSPVMGEGGNLAVLSNV
jgi:ADP-glucose pyrophosphorylase